MEEQLIEKLGLAGICLLLFFRELMSFIPKMRGEKTPGQMREMVISRLEEMDKKYSKMERDLFPIVSTCESCDMRTLSHRIEELHKWHAPDEGGFAWYEKADDIKEILRLVQEIQRQLEQLKGV